MQFKKVRTTGLEPLGKMVETQKEGGESCSVVFDFNTIKKKEDLMITNKISFVDYYPHL